MINRLITRHSFWFAVAAALLVSLLAGPGFTSAQAPPTLPQVYTWQDYGLSIRYPDNWTVNPADNLISLHPADRDVSDGQGPEMVLFALLNTDASQLDALSGTFAGNINGTTSPTITGTLEGYPTRTFTFDQTTPDTVGGVTLVAVENQTVLGAAYTVRDSEANTFLATLKAMRSSLTFGDPSGMVGGVSFSSPNRGGQTYQDAAYGYTVQYPRSWVMQPRDKTGEISLSPQDADLSAGDGPEFVVIILDDLPTQDLDEILNGLIADRPGTFSTPETAALDGYATRFVSYTNTEQTPGVSGVVYLIQVQSDVVIAAGYRAPQPDFATYQPIFESIRKSLHFPAAEPVAPDNAAAAVQEVSQSVASVQLPLQYVWQEAGLMIYLPQDWTVDNTSDASGSTLTAAPAPGTTADQGDVRLMQASTMIWFPGIDLHQIVEALTTDTETISEVADLTVAGYPAVAYDIVDATQSPALHMRALGVAMEDQDMTVLLMFGSSDPAWQNFRPTVDAIIASIEKSSTGQMSALPESGASHPIRARAYWAPDSTPVPQRQDTPPMETFKWEEFGITLDVPQGWSSLPGNGQDYNMAFASPEALQGSQGAFMTWLYIPTLGADTTFESALQPVADQVSGEVQPYTVGGLDGAQVTFTDDQNKATHHMVLIPYGDNGEAFYIQTAAPEGQDDLVQSILDSVQIEPVVPDAEAINQQWQTSLAEDNTLIYGSADAPVKMREFLDFSCSHCAAYSLDVSRLMALDAAPGDLQIEFKMIDIIGGELSRNAALATYCATEQGKGYTAYKALFHDYMIQGRDVSYTRDGITELFSDPQYGVDVDQLNQCLDAGTYTDVLDQNGTDANDAGVTGTPSVLLSIGDEPFQFMTLPDGTTYSGGVPIALLRDIVQRVQDGATSLSSITTDIFGTPEPASTEPSSDTSMDTGAQDQTISAASSGAQSAATAPAQQVPAASAAQSTQAESSSDNSTTSAVIGVAAGLAIVVLIGGAVIWSRRQSPPTSGDSSAPVQVPPASTDENESGSEDD